MFTTLLQENVNMHNELILSDHIESNAHVAQLRVNLHLFLLPVMNNVNMSSW